MKVPFLASILAILLLSQAVAEDKVSTSPIKDNKGGQRLVTLKAKNGVDTILVYDRSNILQSRSTGKRSVTYIYNKNSLLTYANTNKGKIYNVSRDRFDRILSIYGLNSVKLDVSYNGNSFAPSDITITNKAGKIIHPQLSQRSLGTMQGVGPKADQRFARLYEVIALEDEPCDVADCGDPDPGGGGGGEPDPDPEPEPEPDPGSCTDSLADKISTSSAASQPNNQYFATNLVSSKYKTLVDSCPYRTNCQKTCDRVYYLLDKPNCNKKYDLDLRRLCWEIAADDYSECLKECG